MAPRICNARPRCSGCGKQRPGSDRTPPPPYASGLAEFEDGAVAQAEVTGGLGDGEETLDFGYVGSFGQAAGLLAVKIVLSPQVSYSLTRKSRRLHSIPAAGFASPRIFRAPSLRFGPKRSLALANASFTNSLLPITAPSVK
jgi:hypothetical protein